MSRSSACRRWTTASTATFSGECSSAQDRSSRYIETYRVLAFRHIDAVELCFESFLEDIERTRPRYPEERRRPHSPQPPAHSLRSSASSTPRDLKQLERHRALEGLAQSGKVEERDREGERKDVEVTRSAEGY